jgi:hypothetical protein
MNRRAQVAQMGSTATIAVAATVEVLLHGARDEEALDSMDDTVGLGDGGVADVHRGAVATLHGSRSGELALLAGERVRGNEDCSLVLHNLLSDVSVLH